MTKSSKIVTGLLVGVIMAGVGYTLVVKNAQESSKTTAALKSAPEIGQQSDNLGIMGVGGAEKKATSGDDERMREEMRKRLLKLSAVIAAWVKLDNAWQPVDRIANTLTSYGDQLGYTVTSFENKMSAFDSIQSQLADKKTKISIKLNWETSLLDKFQQGNLRQKIYALNGKINDLKKEIAGRKDAIGVNLAILKTIRDAIYKGDGKLEDWTALKLNILPLIEAKNVVNAAYAAGNIDGMLAKLLEDAGKLLTTNNENTIGKLLVEISKITDEVKELKKSLKEGVDLGFTSEGRESRKGAYDPFDNLSSVFSGFDVVVSNLQSFISTFPVNDVQSVITTLTGFQQDWKSVADYANSPF